MGIDEIKIIRNKITETGSSWSAGKTSLSDIPPEERKNHLGLVMSDADLDKIKAAKASEDALMALRRTVSVYPSQWNWRKVSDQDWTTKVKDQDGCGACIAFATVAMIESNLEIFKKDPYLEPDLSEADLFFRGCGACCARGWNFIPALRYAQSSGIPDEKCFPYDDDSTSPCHDRDKRIIKIKSWKTILNASQAKEWISSKGPIMTGMNVYEDFFYYQGGIYKSTYGGYVGDHAICIVGYDDAKGCWICKNSWGAGWGEGGWFRIAYGDSGFGSFGFYAVQFTEDDDIIMPKDGRVFVRLKEKNTAFADEVQLYYPDNKSLFSVTDTNLGKSFEVGSFSAGMRLIFALKTSEGSEGYTYYTDQSLNKDLADHVYKIQTGVNKWELRWEDLFGLGEQDYNDVVMEVEIFGKSTNDLIMPKDGRVIVRFKSRKTSFDDQFMLCYPESRPIFNSTADNIGKAFNIGAFKAGTRLVFSLKTPEGYTYYSDQALNPDFLIHTKSLPTGYNKWELRWADRYEFASSDYKDIVIEVEVVPSEDDDIILARDSHIAARFVSSCTLLNDEFWLYRPDERKIFDAVSSNQRKTFDIGDFPAGTKLTFAIKTSDGNIYYTDSNLNADGRIHVFKLPWGPYKYQLRWEDLYDLKDRDYNDVIVEILMTPKS